MTGPDEDICADCDVCVDCHETFYDGEDEPLVFACSKCGQPVCEDCAANGMCSSCDCGCGPFDD